MNTTRVVATSFRNMTRYKLRSFFMMLGVLVGVAALTIIVAIGKGAERKLMDSVERMFGSSSIMVTSGGGPRRGGPHSDGSRLTIDDIEALAAEIPNIDVWDPVQISGNNEVRYGNQTTTIPVWGYSERADRVWARGASSGEFFDTDAVDRSARVALIGETTSTRLFGDQDPIGEELLIGSVPFRVIGVLERMGTDPHGMDRDDEVAIPITTLMRRVMNVDTIRFAKLLVVDAELIPQTSTEISAVLRERHAISTGEPDDFTLFTPIQIERMVAQANRVLTLYLPLVAGISLLVGGIVAASLMLVSVNSRVPEIGLRRAVGARPADIRKLFLFETITVTLVGGALGAALGLAGAQVVGMHGLPVVVPWMAVATGIASSGVTGVAAGILPARRAAAMEPADALR